MAKIERKNTEIEAQKLTVKNIELHNEAYIKKLRGLANEQFDKIKKVEMIKQMEIEDISSKLVQYEFKLYQAQMETHQHDASIREKGRKVQQFEMKLQEQEQSNFELQFELDQAKAEADSRQKQFDENLVELQIIQHELKGTYKLLT